jgi:hypothetical protein
VVFLFFIFARIAFAGCYTINQIIDAYGFNSLFNAGINGSNVSVAIIDAYGAPNILSDVNNFFSQNGIIPLSSSHFHIYYPFGQPSTFDQNWTIETESDIEVLHSLAPGANIDLVISPNSSYLFSALNWSIYDLPVKVVSVSWGTLSSDAFAECNNFLAKAYYSGISVFTGTGDKGAYNGGSTLSVNFPASSQYVIAVGGTVLQIEGNQYVSESGWNGSGGGVSNFPALSFEYSSNGYRELPDVAFNAGAPYCLLINNTPYEIYGTSLAAPAWAAIGAEIYQLDPYLSNLLPSLYLVYSRYRFEAYHQITSGCNGYYCANGRYNMVTGLGSPILPNLVYFVDNLSFNLSVEQNIPFIVDVNGKNYTAPFTIRLPYNTYIKIKVYPVLFKGNLYVPVQTNYSFILTTSTTINISYETLYPINVINYRPGFNKTFYTNHSLQLVLPKLLLYINGSFENYSSFFGTQPIVFYNNVSVLNLQPNSTYRITWLKLNSTFLQSNGNCLIVNNGLSTFKVEPGEYVYFFNHLYLYPCQQYINSSYLFAFPPFSTNAKEVFVNYTAIKLLPVEIKTINGMPVNGSYFVYYYFGSQLLKGQSIIPAIAQPVLVGNYYINFSVANYNTSSNKLELFIKASYVKAILQPSFLPINVKLSLVSNPSYYAEGTDMAELLIPPNSTIRVVSTFTNNTYTTSGSVIDIALISWPFALSLGIIITVVVGLLVFVLLHRLKRFKI